MDELLYLCILGLVGWLECGSAVCLDWGEVPFSVGV